VSGEQRVNDRDKVGLAATLFMVDTSDPARASVIEKNRDHLLQMNDMGPAHHVYGLVAFDSQLETLCELGCSREEVAEKAGLLRAKGKTTELYRNLLEAIKQIRAFDAERRQIILMSDGLAEDLAYHHEDVITAARNDSIVISAIGYPRSVPQSVALQTLRRLSEETGSLFIQASHIDYQVSETFFARAMSVIDNGGSVTFDLEILQQQGVVGSIDVSLAFQTTEQNFAVLVLVLIPTPNLPAATATSSNPALVPPAPTPNCPGRFRHLVNQIGIGSGMGYQPWCFQHFWLSHSAMP